ncbi:MAG: hypothetical protein EXS25_07775 [Pedosphaera sp.]|nr:hypothetical protein [Pedosphaera sp.]
MNEFLLVAKLDGGFIPCSVDQLTVELAGAAATELDPDWLKQAAAGILHYFKDELGQNQVTIAEFSDALARVLAGLGLTAVISSFDTLTNEGGNVLQKDQPKAESNLPSPTAPHTQAKPITKVWKADLQAIAAESKSLGELDFQRRLRARLDEAIAACPEAVEFSGLRECVKQLTERKHWCEECRRLETWILEVMTSRFSQEIGARRCALLVR